MGVDRGSILGFRKKPTETVQVPEWGGDVHIGVISGVDRHSFFSGMKDDDDGTPHLLVRCIVDANGDRIFTDADAPELAKQPCDILLKLWPVALKVNGLGKEAREEIKKN